MNFVAMMPGGTRNPVEWARQRGDEGYMGVGIGDHIAPAGREYHHLWASLGAIAMACPTLRVASTYANNLFRSPVEFAQASLTLHVISAGRFDAGIGAGWSAEEMAAIGVDYPDAPRRARQYLEAVQIVQSLFRTGTCHFHGEHYNVEQETLGIPTSSVPPLTVATGGSWTIANVAPLADRVELVPFAHVLRGGRYDHDAWQRGSPEQISRDVLRVREHNPRAALSVGAFIAAGTSAAVQDIADRFGRGPCSGLAGPPEHVADTLHSFADIGIERCSVIELVPGTFTTLSRYLNR